MFRGSESHFTGIRWLHSHLNYRIECFFNILQAMAGCWLSGPCMRLTTSSWILEEPGLGGLGV